MGQKSEIIENFLKLRCPTVGHLHPVVRIVLESYVDVLALIIQEMRIS